MRNLVLLVPALLVCVFSSGCSQKAEPKVEPNPDFSELRLHRWTALEGGEMLVIRQNGSDWSAMLLGDGNRFSCLYQKPVKPRSDWQQLWNTMLLKGLDRLPNGYEAEYLVEDGNGFNVELFYQGKLTRLAMPHPESQNSTVARSLLEISDLVAQEFNTPVFVADYNRGEVGEYLIANCNGFSR